MLSLSGLPQHTHFSTQLLSYSVPFLDKQNFFLSVAHLHCREKKPPTCLAYRDKKGKEMGTLCGNHRRTGSGSERVSARSILVLWKKRQVHIGRNHCQGHTVPGTGMEKGLLNIVKANNRWQKGLRTDKCKKIKAFCCQVAPCVPRAARPEARRLQGRQGALCGCCTHTRTRPAASKPCPSWEACPSRSSSEAKAENGCVWTSSESFTWNS